MAAPRTGIRTTTLALALLAGAAHAGVRDALDAARVLRALRDLGAVASVRITGEVRRVPLDPALAERLGRRVDLRLTLRTGEDAALAVQAPVAPGRWLREARPDVTAVPVHLHLDAGELRVGAVLPGREGEPDRGLGVRVPAEGEAGGSRGERRGRGGGGALEHDGDTFRLRTADGAREVFVRHDAGWLPTAVQVFEGERETVRLELSGWVGQAEGAAAALDPPLPEAAYAPLSWVEVSRVLALVADLPERIAPPTPAQVFPWTRGAGPRAPRRREPAPIPLRALSPGEPLPFRVVPGLLGLFDLAELHEALADGARRVRRGLEGRQERGPSRGPFRRRRPFWRR